jgi:hypothetical protein
MGAFSWNEALQVPVDPVEQFRFTGAEVTEPVPPPVTVTLTV